VAGHFAAASLAYNRMDSAGTLERDERKNREVLIMRRGVFGPLWRFLWKISDCREKKCFGRLFTSFCYCLVIQFFIL